MVDLIKQASLQSDLAKATFNHLEGNGPWAHAVLQSSVIGDANRLRFRVTDASGQVLRYEFPDRRTIRALFGELKQMMTDAEQGAWLSVTMSLSSSGDYRFTFNWDSRIYYNNPVGSKDWLVPDPHDDPYPMDSDYVTEFQRFPRTDSQLPAWFGPALAGVKNDDVRARRQLDEAISVDVVWPPEKASLASSEDWSIIWKELNSEVLRQIRSEQYLPLLLELNDPDGYRIVDGLWQDTVAAVERATVQTWPVPRTMDLEAKLRDESPQTTATQPDTEEPNSNPEGTLSVNSPQYKHIIEEMIRLTCSIIGQRFPFAPVD